MKNNIKKMACYSISWFGGYIGFWAMKWVLTDILVGGSTIKDAFSTILQRTGSAEEQSRIAGLLTVVFKNLSAYTNWAFLPIILLI